MAFSIWDYLKQRAKYATLAGIQEALDVAEEGGDFETSQKAAADRFTARLGGQAATQLPEPANVTTRQPGPENVKVASPPPVRGRTFGDGLEPVQAPAQAPAPDPFEERLNGPTPKPEPQDRRGPSRSGHPAPDPELETPPPQPEAPERRKRGRPRKDEG